MARVCKPKWMKRGRVIVSLGTLALAATLRANLVPMDKCVLVLVPATPVLRQPYSGRAFVLLAMGGRSAAPVQVDFGIFRIASRAPQIVMGGVYVMPQTGAAYVILVTVVTPALSEAVPPVWDWTRQRSVLPALREPRRM